MSRQSTKFHSMLTLEMRLPKKWRFNTGIVVAAARLVLYAASGMALTACANGRPVYAPLVLNADAGFVAESQKLRTELNAMDPVERIYRSMTIVDSRCDKFFDNLEALRANVRYGGRQTSSLSTGLPPLLEAARASSLGIATVSAALGFIGGALSDYDELYLLSNFKGAIYKKWQSAREDASGRLESLIINSDSRLLSDEFANRQIYRYSSLCLHSQLINWLNQAADGGKVTATNDIEIETETAPESPSLGVRKRSRTSGPNTRKNSAGIRSRTIPSYFITSQ